MRLPIPTRASLPVLCTTIALGGLLAGTPAAMAQVTVETQCSPAVPFDVPADCDPIPAEACTSEGFHVALINFNIDQLAGESVWEYEVCAGTSECPTEEGDLSHVDLALPGLRSCLDEDHSVSVTVIDNPGTTCAVDPEEATFTCDVEETDPSCDVEEEFVAKCDVVDDSLENDKNECVRLELRIAGEQPSLGAGGVTTVSKTGPECSNETSILGPSCDPCIENGGDGDQCLTRTRGFWGTHPHIADQFLDVTVCGVVQTTTEARVCGTSEALCYNNSDLRPANPQSLELVAQLTAAKLNLNSTFDIFGTTCGGFEYDGMKIQEWIDYCEQGFCNGSKKQISESGCIEALDAFNNSQDTGLDQTPEPFDHPGPAQVGECQDARGNGISNYTCVQP